VKKTPISLLIVEVILLIWGFADDSIKSAVPMGKLLFFVVLILITLLIQMFIYAKHKAVGFWNNDILKSPRFPCHIFAAHEHCCVREYQSHLINNSLAKVIASPEFLSRYKLLSKDDMIEREGHFRQGTKADIEKREVWIFSHDLSTEVSSDAFQGIAAMNVNAGVKYIYFYIGEQANSTIVNTNKKKILQLINTNKRNSHVAFISIANPQPDSEKLNLLPSILGSIVFISRDKTTVTKESYFSLRKDPRDDEPTYFKMPTCMKDAFYEYFESLVRATEQEVSQNV
jgi:hypothetical protein